MSDTVFISALKALSFDNYIDVITIGRKKLFLSNINYLGVYILRFKAYGWIIILCTYLIFLHVLKLQINMKTDDLTEKWTEITALAPKSNKCKRCALDPRAPDKNN